MQAVALAAAPGKYRAVRLPYKGSSGLAAVFVLPDAEAYESIMDAAREITAAAVLDPKAWQDVSEPMAVSLPRFKVEVKQLGLKEVRGQVENVFAKHTAGASNLLFYAHDWLGLGGCEVLCLSRRRHLVGCLAPALFLAT